MDYYLLGKLPEEAAAKPVDRTMRKVSMIRSLRLWHYLTRYVDGFLLSGILLLMLTGLFTLYSATDANLKSRHQSGDQYAGRAGHHVAGRQHSAYSISCALPCRFM